MISEFVSIHDFIKGLLSLVKRFVENNFFSPFNNHVIHGNYHERKKKYSYFWGKEVKGNIGSDQPPAKTKNPQTLPTSSPCSWSTPSPAATRPAAVRLFFPLN